MTVQEKDDIKCMHMQAGGATGNIDDERVVTMVAAVGEGWCRPSWVWYSGNNHENLDDPLMHIGTLLLLVLSCF